MTEEVRNSNLTLKERNQRIREMIVHNLSTSNSVRNMKGVLERTTDSYERAGLILELAENAISDSNIRSIGSTYYFFTGRIYEKISKAIFVRSIKAFLFEQGVTDKDWFRFYSKFRRPFEIAVELNELVPTSRYLAFQNCVVDFNTLDTHDFHPDYHITHILDYSFSMDQHCPIWEKFLSEVLPNENSRLVLQMFLGLAFVDRPNFKHKIEKALILVGSGSNGKSVIFETILGILGHQNMSFMEMGALTKGGEEGYRNIVTIDGKKFNYCSEERIDAVFKRTDLFKSIVSGEPMYARRIGGNLYKVTRIPFLIFNMNKPPKFNDDSHAMYRRFLVIPFSVVIPDELQNKHLADDLKGEYSGILKWLYNGYRLFLANDCKFPEGEDNVYMKNLIISSQSPYAAWLSEYGYRATAVIGVAYDEPVEISSSDLYNSYHKYCVENNLKSESQRMFGGYMSDAGFMRNRKSGGYYYTVYGAKEADFVFKDNDEEFDLGVASLS